MSVTGFERSSLDVLVDTRAETVTALLRATAPVREQLHAVVQDVAARLDAPIAALNLVRDDAVLVAAATGLSGWVAESGGMPSSWAICPRVTNPDRPLLVGDLHAEQWGVFSASTLFGWARAYAGVPVRVDGAVVGTLCAMAPEPHAFNEGTVTVLEQRRDDAVRLLRHP